MMIVPADPADDDDAYSPFLDDTRLWKFAEIDKETKKKMPLHFNRLAGFFRAATEELKPLPSVNEHADSHIIRAAHMVTCSAAADPLLPPYTARAPATSI